MNYAILTPAEHDFMNDLMAQSRGLSWRMDILFDRINYLEAQYLTAEQRIELKSLYAATGKLAPAYYTIINELSFYSEVIGFADGTRKMLPDGRIQLNQRITDYENWMQ